MAQSLSSSSSSSMSAASSPPLVQDPGRTDTDRDTEGYTKKATLIALVSLGVTLLVTGATSRRLLQKPPSAATTAATTGASTTTTASGLAAASSVVRTSNAAGTPPLRHAAVAPSRRASSQLRALFASADPDTTNKMGKVDFRANQHTGFAFAQQIPILASDAPSAPSAASSAPGPAAAAAAAVPAQDAAQSADPTMDAMLDAVKAFGIATALLLGTTGFGAFLIARKVGATDFDSFFHALRHEIMHPLAQKLEPNLPDWLKQRQRDPDEIANDEREEHEVTSALRQEWREFVQEATDEQRRKDGKDLIVKAS